jgi:hypothetical protein
MVNIATSATLHGVRLNRVTLHRLRRRATLVISAPARGPTHYRNTAIRCLGGWESRKTSDGHGCVVFRRSHRAGQPATAFAGDRDRRRAGTRSQDTEAEARKRKAPSTFSSPGRLGSPPPELPNHEMDIRIPFILCKCHFGNLVSAELSWALTEVTLKD